MTSLFVLVHSYDLVWEDNIYVVVVSQSNSGVVTKREYTDDGTPTDEVDPTESKVKKKPKHQIDRSIN